MYRKEHSVICREPCIRDLTHMKEVLTHLLGYDQTESEIDHWLTCIDSGHSSAVLSHYTLTQVE